MHKLASIIYYYFIIFSGIKQEDKRGGTGKGNWGTYEDDLNTTDEAIANTSVEETAAVEVKEGEEKLRKEKRWKRFVNSAELIH